MKVSDILLDEALDLLFENGDFVIGESTGQHIEELLLLSKGGLRASPLLGADIERLKNEDAYFAEVKADMQEALETDGLKVNSISFNEKLQINAEYV